MTEYMDLDEAKLVKELNELILADARAVYGSSYPTQPSQLTIITSGRTSYLNGARYDYITAQLIVYTKPGSLAQWKLLVAGTERGSVSNAMKSLWTEVQSKMQAIIGPMQLGETWKGSKNV